MESTTAVHGLLSRLLLRRSVEPCDGVFPDAGAVCCTERFSTGKLDAQAVRHRALRAVSNAGRHNARTRAAIQNSLVCCRSPCFSNLGKCAG